MERVTAQFGTKVLHSYEFRGQCAITIRPGDLRAVLVWLRDDPEIATDWLMDVGGVDYLGFSPADGSGDDDRIARFEVAYQLYSMKHNHRVRVKVAVPEDKPTVPSVWDLWGTANWMEREVWDLYGIRFEGHPNLIRILCHHQFEGHALRKDYPINRRQRLSSPLENILCAKAEWA
jgi:NADH/F420H2 dehydrogenase subunit C